MNILLLGNNGQLGWELHRTLGTFGVLIALDYPEIDLTDFESVRPIIRGARPDIIVNATAYTDVDRAESEIELAMAINDIASGLLAEEAQNLGAALIHYSTDYVFDGNKKSAYIESDLPNPKGIYGQSKLNGELAIQKVSGAYLILRTSWVYSLRRESFVTKVLKWSRLQNSLRVVTDQIANPTWARALAEITSQIIAKGNKDIVPWIHERRGLYHLAGSGHASRLEWAQAIIQLDPRREEQITQDIRPALTAEFPTPAQRPLFSALNCDLFKDTFGLSLPHWEDALRLAMAFA